MQPQQQAVVVQQQPSVVYVRPPVAPVTVENYKTRQSTALGIVLIVAGALSVIFNIVDLAVGSSNYSDYYFYAYRGELSSESNGKSGHGFWCGSTFIIAGAFGVIAGRNKNRCMITTFMTLTIISAVFAGIQIIIAGSGAGRVGKLYRQTKYCDIIDYCTQVRVVYSMEILLALLGALAFAANLWGSILCCSSNGCCQSSVIATPVMMQSPHMTVVSQQQQQPAGQMGYYPPQQNVMVNPPPYAYNNYNTPAYYPPPQQPQYPPYQPTNNAAAPVFTVDTKY